MAGHQAIMFRCCKTFTPLKNKRLLVYSIDTDELDVAMLLSNGFWVNDYDNISTPTHWCDIPFLPKKLEVKCNE